MPERRDWMTAAIHLPAAAVLTAWLVLLPNDGGYFARDWLVAALALLALLVMLLMAGRRFEGRDVTRVLAAYAAFVAWSFASMLWADSAGRGWEASDQLLAYLLCAAVLAATPWRAPTATAFMGAFSLGFAVILLVGLLNVAGETELGAYFVESRWAGPLGYPNGSAAVAVVALIPALLLSARADLPPLAQAGAFTVAAVLTGIAMLPQSRGSVVGGSLAIAVALLLVPHRWRLTARLALMAVLIAVLSGPVFGVYTAGIEEDPVGPALDEAVRAILIAAPLAGLAVLALALGEARIQLGERGRRRSRRAGLAVLGLAALAVIAVGVIKSERLGDEISTQWDALASPGIERTEDEEDDSGSRLLRTDPETRYDLVHVSVEAFLDAPLGGLGSGNFGPYYTAERKEKTHAEFPHNIFVRPLAETGVVGTLLLLGFVFLVLRGLLPGLSAAPAPTRGIVAAALATFTYFIGHGQFDWLEEFTALTMPVLGLLIVAMVVRRSDIPVTRLAAQARAAPLPRAAYIAAGATALVVAAALFLPFAAIRYQDRANRLWRTNAAEAYRQLDRAKGANPLSSTPYVIEGVIAVQRREHGRARRAFREAQEREPSWLARFELGLLAAAGGDRAGALREFAAAHRLNSIEPAIDEAEEAVREGERLDPRAATLRLFDRDLYRRIPVR